ncbi:MAG: ROK family protein [Pseudomonadota bacterium]|nr:ROK family protein [Pseudomonadota bacterium]
MRIGVDVGGTKIEAIAIADDGRELARRRVPSANDYAGVVEAVRRLVVGLENEIGATASVGVGCPGAVSRSSGLIKNANSTQLNSRPFDADLAAALARPVRVENDANCFALSEAIDGAGAGHALVFGVILGTGVGGGIVHDGRVWIGANSIAGEWGHNEMPARAEPGMPDTLCYCGRRRCVETYLSGPALAADHGAGAAGLVEAPAIVASARAGNAVAQATMSRFYDRLARALAAVVNVLDPDVVVLGGGLSKIDGLTEEIATRLPSHVFSDRCTTPIVRNRHGDSSGVRGAAWLWPRSNGAS